MVLLTPGPCMTSESVRQAAAAPDLNHREPEYAELVAEVKRGLLAASPGFASGWTPCLLGGSGTAAVEAAATTCVRSGPVLVVENGYYSGRIVEILEAHGIPHGVFRLGWDEGWGGGAMEGFEAMLASGAYEAVFATHHETTLGRLNPIADLARLARRHGARMLVDAMSSFGADPLDPADVDVVVSSANKCLHGIPGVSFVLVREALAEEMVGWRRRTFYLHLPMLMGDSPPVTPPVPAMLALRQGLRENPGGQPARFAQYRAKVGALRHGLTEIGLEFAVPETDASCTLVAARLPEGWTYDDWYGANHEAGFALYGCKGDFRERYFQASVMGETTLAHIRDWLGCAARLIGGR